MAKNAIPMAAPTCRDVPALDSSSSEALGVLLGCEVLETLSDFDTEDEKLLKALAAAAAWVVPATPATSSFAPACRDEVPALARADSTEEAWVLAGCEVTALVLETLAFEINDDSLPDALAAAWVASEQEAELLSC
jgi:hypothetical protein